ncbi:aminotransferase class V-fold PLP-dependent enzyme [Legionella geestiana]|uniref:aminotransferase class V-fold PLP-dependent enzyme n=1 Tax=Legionella geestiana TaxID=45065 RepID=UPI0010922C9E|nr:aminotransferase class V-fold PLP-dependent enzyme [Legionella geestiana]QDQ40194.1 aminotransferase class V-fold PLP-dependent enzyme [Legionella geestiana]
MSKLNINKLREDTIGCMQVLHFNNAGAALQPNPVITSVKSHIDLEALIGGYEAAEAVKDDNELFYDLAACLINCSRDEIAYTNNATHAWNMAFYSIAFKANDKIITSISEYASNYLAFLHVAKRNNVVIDIIPNDEHGQLDIEELRKKIDGRVKLIAITHVPTQGGLINPVKEVGAIAQQYNIRFLLDATQSIGQMPIDVTDLKCDFLCATGRKFLRGPRGTGFLYVSKNAIQECSPPFITLNSATLINVDSYVLANSASRFETWEQNIAAKLGLKTAIQYSLDLGLQEIWKRIQHLSKLLRQHLAEIDGVKIQDLGINKCGIISFSCKNKSPNELKNYLATKHMNVSVSSQKIAPLDLIQRKITSLIRASVHYYNTEEEIVVFCDELRKFTKS